METVEAYFERKVDELRPLNDCLRDPLPLTSPGSVTEVVKQKFQLAAATQGRACARRLGGNRNGLGTCSTSQRFTLRHKFTAPLEI
jgi:hypothetical protein